MLRKSSFPRIKDNMLWSKIEKCLSHDVTSRSDNTLCNKIDKPLVVYRFSGNVMTSIITLGKSWQNIDVSRQNACFN